MLLVLETHILQSISSVMRFQLHTLGGILLHIIFITLVTTDDMCIVGYKKYHFPIP
jgi:hypothetical protein